MAEEMRYFVTFKPQSSAEITPAYSILTKDQLDKMMRQNIVNKSLVIPHKEIYSPADVKRYLLLIAA